MSAFGSDEIPTAVVEFMKNFGTKMPDYDFYAFNQTYQNVLKNISEKLKIQIEKVLINLAGYGDTAGNSIPLLLTDVYGGRAIK